MCVWMRFTIFRFTFFFRQINSHLHESDIIHVFVERKSMRSNLILFIYFSSFAKEIMCIRYDLKKRLYKAEVGLEFYNFSKRWGMLCDVDGHINRFENLYDFLEWK